jgi:hypothetical protein
LVSFLIKPLLIFFTVGELSGKFCSYAGCLRSNGKKVKDENYTLG